MTQQTKKQIREALQRFDKQRYMNIPDHCRALEKIQEGSANQITTTVVKFLIAEGHQAERINTMGVYRDNSEVVTDVLGRKKRIGGGQWTKGGGTPGSADIHAQIKPQGQRYAIPVKIEVKYGKDRQSKAQKVYQANVEAAGGVYWIVRNLDEFIEKYNALCP